MMKQAMKRAGACGTEPQAPPFILMYEIVSITDIQARRVGEMNG